jgi:hypothetical protein
LGFLRRGCRGFDANLDELLSSNQYRFWRVIAALLLILAAIRDPSWWPLPVAGLAVGAWYWWRVHRLRNDQP